MVRRRAKKRAPRDEGLAVRSRLLRARRDIRGLNPLHAGLGHIGPGFCERTLIVYAAAGVFPHIDLEARLARVERGPGHAEIRRQPRDEDALDLAPLQIAGETRRGLAIGFEEGRIAVDVLVKTLADDELGVRDR